MGLYGVLGVRSRMLYGRGGVVWEHENTNLVYSEMYQCLEHHNYSVLNTDTSHCILDLFSL